MNAYSPPRINISLSLVFLSRLFSTIGIFYSTVLIFSSMSPSKLTLAVCLERKWEKGKHRLKEIICLERRRDKVKEKKIGRDSPSRPSVLHLSNLGSLQENQLKITIVCLKYIIFMLDMGVKWSFCSSNFFFTLVNFQRCRVR